MSASNQALIESLAKSDLGRQALAEIEAERSRGRTAILTQLAQQQAELERKNLEARAKAAALLLKVVAAHAAHAELCAQLAEIEREASNASFAADASRCRAIRDLGELGQQTIELTRRRLWGERMDLNNRAAFASIHGENGEIIGTRPRNPEIAERLEQIASHLAELEGMELSELSPTSIEQRCEEMLAGLIEPIKAPRAGPIAGVVTAEGKLIRPARA